MAPPHAAAESSLSRPIAAQFASTAHIAVTLQGSNGVYDPALSNAIQQLPHSHGCLVLTHFTITVPAATAGRTWIHDRAFTSQHSLDAWMAALPGGTAQSAREVAAGFDHARSMLDDVYVEVRATLQDDDDSSVWLLTPIPTVLMLHLRSDCRD